MLEKIQLIEELDPDVHDINVLFYELRKVIFPIIVWDAVVQKIVLLVTPLEEPDRVEPPAVEHVLSEDKVPNLVRDLEN